MESPEVIAFLAKYRIGKYISKNENTKMWGFGKSPKNPISILIFCEFFKLHHLEKNI